MGYEIDAAPTQKNKTKILHELGVEGVDDVTFIPCDFESEDWLEKLTGAGFDSSLSTLYLWEGVIYYLNEDAVKETLRKISSVDSALVAFDYFNLKKQSKSGGKLFKGLKEPLMFSADEEEIERLVQLFDMKVLEQLKYKEIKGRYCSKYYDGSSLGYLEDFGGFVLAG